jgi:adenylosuccinate synthase
MPLDIVVGAQWGDEGKGRITDLLAAQADVVARYSGGDNAGHTVTIGEEIFRLHLIPSGIIHPDVICVIGNGVVVNSAVLIGEMEGLADRGVDVSPERLKISTQAHLITPAHIALDRAHEAQRGDEAIGTTLRGIGPAYGDKTARCGLRAHLLANPEALADAVYEHVADKNEWLAHYGEPLLDASAVAAEFAHFARRLAPHLVEGSPFLNAALEAGKVILAEGAQGTLLDLDHGTYPFVTSSTPTAGGALTGLGVGPTAVRRVVGVAKAFTTRVGGGPFPCELSGELAERLRGTGENPWDEFGTTTGRPRRVGWLDTVVLRHARRVNGMTEMALTKLDILSGFDELAICTGYKVEGRRIDYLPGDLGELRRAQPVYEWLPGWREDVTGARAPSDLPANARRYIDFVAQAAGVPISLVSVGPARDQIVQGWN